MRITAILASSLLLASTSAWAASTNCPKDVPYSNTPLIENSDSVWSLSLYGLQPIEQPRVRSAAEPYQLKTPVFPYLPTMAVSPGVHDYNFVGDSPNTDLWIQTFVDGAHKGQPESFPTLGCDRPNMTLSITALGPHHLQIECK